MFSKCLKYLTLLVCLGPTTLVSEEIDVVKIASVGQKVLSESYDPALFFFDENDPTGQYENHKDVWDGNLRVLNIEVQALDLSAINETLQNIIDTEADVVCFHNVSGNGIGYRLASGLRRAYGYFCVVEGARTKAHTFIASKYRIDATKSGFLDNDGIFCEIRLADLRSGIARILVARPDFASSSEVLDESGRTATPSICKFSANAIPTLLVEGFSNRSCSSGCYTSLLEKYFQKDDATNTCLLLTNQASQEAFSIGLGNDFTGVVSDIIVYNYNTILSEDSLISCQDQNTSDVLAKGIESSAHIGVGYDNNGWHFSAGAGVRNTGGGRR